jgi:hypothetical protein
MRLSDIKKEYPEYLSLTEVSKVTGVWREKIMKLIAMRKVKPISLYRVRMTFYLFSPEDVEKIKELKGSYFSVDSF